MDRSTFVDVLNRKTPLQIDMMLSLISEYCDDHGKPSAQTGVLLGVLSSNIRLLQECMQDVEDYFIRKLEINKIERILDTGQKKVIVRYY